MDPQDPITSTPSPVVEPFPPKAPSNNQWITILSMAVFVLLSLGTVAFLYYQNQQLKNMLYQPQTSNTPLPTESPSSTPTVSPTASASASPKTIKIIVNPTPTPNY